MGKVKGRRKIQKYIRNSKTDVDSIAKNRG